MRVFADKYKLSTPVFNKGISDDKISEYKKEGNKYDPNKIIRRITCYFICFF
jgi:hypothetical protein